MKSKKNGNDDGGAAHREGRPAQNGSHDERPEIGRESQLFEGDLVNASMIPDVFGYHSLGENRERLNELEEYACEELGCNGRAGKENPLRGDERA